MKRRGCGRFQCVVTASASILSVTPEKGLFFRASACDTSQYQNRNEPSVHILLCFQSGSNADLEKKEYMLMPEMAKYDNKKDMEEHYDGDIRCAITGHEYEWSRYKRIKQRK